MKWSNCFLKTKREIKEDCISYELLLKAGLVTKMSSGVFNYHSILLKSIRNLEDIIRKELDNLGYEEMMLAQMHSRQLWEQSGRWEKMGDNLMKVVTRQKQEFCFAGTHEEAVVEYVKTHITSYKDLDIKLYQIQNKFRDEVRTKFGLIRGKEFLMKDAYSFGLDRSSVEQHYYEMVEAYKRIFNQLEIEYVVVEADAGSIGGTKTHEFQMISEIGDDRIFFCQDCQAFGNQEVMKQEGYCHKCNSQNLQWKKGIELGHCFLLGEEYSRKMGLAVLNQEGKQQTLHMTCHGIGVSRTIQAVFEQLHDDKGLIWSKALSAYQVQLVHVGKSQSVKDYAQNIYQELKTLGVEVFWDDREGVSTGVKFNDMDKIGFTYQVVVSEKTMVSNTYEFCLRKDKGNKELLSKEALLDRFK